MEKNKIDYNVQVTMVELDKTVMEVVREHMPSVAGGALDCKGERSKVFDKKSLQKFFCNFLAFFFTLGTL